MIQFQSQFPSHLITKRIRKEILADAAKLAAATLPHDVPEEEAAQPESKGLMLEIRFSPKREKGEWLRVAFVNRFESSLRNNAYRIGYDRACGGFPVTRVVLAHSISSRIFTPFVKMIASGLRQEEVMNWILAVAKLAEINNGFDVRLVGKQHPEQQITQPS